MCEPLGFKPASEGQDCLGRATPSNRKNGAFMYADIKLGQSGIISEVILGRITSYADFVFCNLFGIKELAEIVS